MIAVIGGGISGLAVALELQKWCEPCIVLEAGSNPGGVIQSELKNEYLLEYGANSILADEDLKEYLKNLGLENEIYSPANVSKNRYVYKNGRYNKLPTNPISALFGSFLSLSSKISVIKELSKAPAPKKDETLGELIERRFSKEIAEYILAPFVSGIFAGDPYKLLVSETFPFLHKLEEEHGSIIKGFIKNKKSGGRKESLYFKSGMQSVTDAMASKVKKLKTNVSVEEVEKDSSGFHIKYKTPEGTEKILVEAVIVSSPAYAAEKFLKSSFPEFSEALSKINYAPIVKTFFAYNKVDIPVSLNGFGALNPPCENQYILGSLYNSAIYPFVAPSGKTLITSMVGGATQSGHTEMKDDFILNRVKSDLADYYKIKKEPVFSHIKRMDKAIPQYDKEVLRVKQAAAEVEKEDLFVCANWLGGPGLSDCIKKARKLAVKITEARAGVTDYTGCC